jgi:hypothetical protein
MCSVVLALCNRTILTRSVVCQPEASTSLSLLELCRREYSEVFLRYSEAQYGRINSLGM